MTECTASVSTVSVFEMTDALAEGDASSALRLLHRLMEDEDPMGLFAVIVAHFRGLLVTREILDEGGGAAQVIEALHRPPFVANKMIEQARGFKMPRLEAIYHRLDRMDAEMKMGQMSMDLALEILVVESRE